MGKNRGKRLQTPETQKFTKTPKVAASTIQPQDATPLFCFKHADRASDNPWKFAFDGDEANEVFDFICEMSKLTWAAIALQQTGPSHSRRPKHHFDPITKLVSAAQKDLERMRLDETFGDTIYRFRLAGEERLWGFRADRTFHVVWWDTGHDVYGG